MTDVYSRCVVDIYDDLDRGTRLATERGWRWIIAYLRDDEATEERIEEHMRHCIYCLKGFAMFFAGLSAGMLAADIGKDNALIIAQHFLDEVLTAPYLTEPPTLPPEAPGWP